MKTAAGHHICRAQGRGNKHVQAPQSASTTKVYEDAQKPEALQVASGSAQMIIDVSKQPHIGRLQRDGDGHVKSAED